MRFLGSFLILSWLVVSCSTPTPKIIVVTATPPPQVATATVPFPIAVSSLTPLPTAVPPIDPNLVNKIRALGCITYIDADAYIGQTKCVGGLVASVFKDPSSTTFFIDFDAARIGFYAVSFKERFDDLNGKCVIVTGKIDRFLGRPQIIINDRSQIKLCE